MNASRILMAGYYGKGNFGDDILLQVAYGLVREQWPQAEISLLVDGDRGAYVNRLLGPVTMLPPGRHGHFDLIVHGGGGVFFDFAPQPALSILRNRLLLAFGPQPYLVMEAMLRRLLNKRRTSATRRIGLGIGMGTYTPGSPEWLRDLPILADFAALWVRDTQSMEHLARLHTLMRAQLVEGSDLAFLTEYWMKPVPPRVPSPRPRLGIILRDWTEEAGSIHAAAVKQWLASLAGRYDITGFIFDRSADPYTAQLLAPYPTHIWEPSRMRLEEFSALLATQDVVLTSRAHGAIAAACLGIPSVILNIEPKLSTVHAMVPGSSRLVSPGSMETWLHMIEDVRSISPDNIAQEVQQNRAASLAAWQAVKRWCT